MLLRKLDRTASTAAVGKGKIVLFRPLSFGDLHVEEAFGEFMYRGIMSGVGQ